MPTKSTVSKNTGFDQNASVERSLMASPPVGKIDDEYDFSVWNLGSGKIAEKRVRLTNLVN
jgi:hypothetical protein